MHHIQEVCVSGAVKDVDEMRSVDIENCRIWFIFKAYFEFKSSSTSVRGVDLMPTQDYFKNNNGIHT